MPEISRRSALKALGFAATATVSGGAAAAGYAIGSQSQTAPAPAAPQLLPFEGVHQAGIITAPPDAVLVAALDISVSSYPDLVRLFRKISERVRALSAGNVGDGSAEEEAFPPKNTGDVGYEAIKDGHLAITLALGAPMFDARFGLADRKPVALTAMPRDLAGDRLDPAYLGGDICLQISSDHPLYNMHALRDILKNTKGQLTPRWVQSGFQKFHAAPPGQAAGRGLLGFKDGSANLDTTDSNLMTRLVWAADPEPQWAQGGTYMVVRKIREQLERWDRLTLAQQEDSVGRHKVTGAPQSGTRETDSPAYAADPNGDTTPLNAHIRKANPRLGPESDKRRMLRRGYLYFDGADKSGLLDAGFLFMCFCRNVQEQFEYVKRNYMTNRNFPQAGTGAQDLDEYMFCIGGGYFYAPPGVRGADRFLADALLLG